jgi:hypothetical protein
MGVPVLWLIGPSGVGKSTVGFAIFGRLRRAGVPAGYLDLDQVGLCYPTLPDDPDNHRVKSANLGAVWPAYRDAGVRRFVLSGGAATPDEARLYADRVPDAALTVCRLRVGPDELRARFQRRGWRPDLVEESVREAELLDRTDFADHVVDTTGLSVPDVARRIRRHWQ